MLYQGSETIFVKLTALGTLTKRALGYLQEHYFSQVSQQKNVKNVGTITIDKSTCCFFDHYLTADSNSDLYIVGLTFYLAFINNTVSSAALIR